MFQITIIGAGPVGSYLAYKLAIAGYKVLVLEQGKKAGDNVCCTGIISKECFERLHLDHSVKYREFKSAKLIGPLEQISYFARNSTVAYAVDKSALNKFLADKAISAGVSYRFSSRVIDIQIVKDEVHIYTLLKNVAATFKSQIAILATGFNSRLIEKSGFRNINNFTIGAQVEVVLHNCAEPEIFVDNLLAPGGFGWLIPTWGNKGLAGILCQHRPKYFLNEFKSYLISKDKIAFSDSVPKYGVIPLKSLKKTSSNRLLVIGEAAGQVKPTTGGGIYYGILCADIAAFVIDEGFKKNNLSPNQLSNYEKRWHKVLKAELASAYFLHLIWKRLNNKHLIYMQNIIRKLRIAELINKSEDFEFDWHTKILLRIIMQIATTIFKS